MEETSISEKIAVGLERISEAYKALLWNEAKKTGLSPIQIQILIFISKHKDELCNISQLAQEFNLTKPTVSDAVKTLEKKQLIIKDFSVTDNRSFCILLSKAGERQVVEIQDYYKPVEMQLEKLPQEHLESLYSSISGLIYGLNQIGVLNVQRTCFGCKFYEKTAGGHFCHLLEQPIANKEIRLDCNEFEAIEKA